MDIKEKIHNTFKKFLYDKQTLDCKNAISKIDKSCSKINYDKVFCMLYDNKIGKNMLMSETLYKDIEFWDSVYPKIHRGLLGSNHFLRALLESPSNNIDQLEKRKSTIAMAESIDSLFFDKIDSMSSEEETVLSFFEDVDEDIKDLYSMAYFKLYLLRRFNRCPEALTAYNLYRIIGSPIVGLLSPIVYFLLPYLVIVYKFKIKISFINYLRLTWESMMSMDYMSFFGMGNSGSRYKLVQLLSYVFSLVFYFQGLFNSFEISKTIYKVSKHVCEKVNKVSEFLKSAVEIVSKHWKNDYGVLFGVDGLLSTEQEVAYVQGLPSFKFGLLSNFGRHLESYVSFSKDTVSSILKKLYILNTLGSLVKFRQDYNYGYTEFITGSKPVIKLKGLRHPGIDKGLCVANDFVLGDSVPNNAIITGTNAGGKSVTIKALLINCVLSQTVAISCCDAAAITPLSHVSSQINVPDSTGHESLFQAELYRCKNSLDTLSSLGGRFSLIVMDEIFSSTNPIEAISGAYAVCEKIASYDNNILVFTTHLNYLTNLKKTNRFLNYKMDTIVNGDDFKFTYKLVKGVNKHYLALEILKKNGFDSDIVERALQIKKKFV